MTSQVEGASRWIANWSYRGPVNTGPWKGGYYISKFETSVAVAFASTEEIADLIVRSVNAIPDLLRALEEIVANAESGKWTLPSSFANRARAAIQSAKREG